jgi:hypothetical protein
MALTVGFADGFDHYLDATNSPLGLKSQWTASGSIGLSFKTPGFKGRGKCLNVDQPAGTGGNKHLFRAVPSCNQISQHTALRFLSPKTDAAMQVLGWNDILNATQFSLYLLPSGQLGLYRGLGNTLLAVSNYAAEDGIVHRYNFAFDFTNPISGSAQMWIDGDPNKGFNISGVDLLATANNDVRSVSLEIIGGGTNPDQWNYDVDDYMFCYGAATNIGEMELITSAPTADFQKQWTPLTGTDNFAMVDEIPPDGDTSYNSSSVVGHVDLQTFAALPVTPDSIFCVTQIIGAKKEESGTRGIAPVVKMTTEHDGTTQNVTTDYTWYYEHYLKNPETTAAWLASERAAAHWGYKDAL